jgi:proteasome assembly chaperone (PAC2) family protein
MLADLFAAVSKKIPVFCWGVVCMCLLAYTSTLCFVMLRSSTMSVEVSGMTMELGRAAGQQDRAASELEQAARVIKELREEIAAMTVKAQESSIPFFRPAPAPAPAVLAPKVDRVAEDLEIKADKLREDARQTHQRVQQVQQQQQQQVGR